MTKATHSHRARGPQRGRRRRRPRPKRATTRAAEQSPATPQRGAPLFSDKYNCYACHGFDAQTGERRLVPMNYTQDGFITFVQSSPLPNMPRFPRRIRAAPRRHLRVHPHDPGRRTRDRRRAGAARHSRASTASARQVAQRRPVAFSHTFRKRKSRGGEAPAFSRSTPLLRSRVLSNPARYPPKPTLISNTFGPSPAFRA